MATLNYETRILAFDDAPEGAGNNPLRRLVDWTRRVLGRPILRARVEGPFQVAPFATFALFDGTRTLGVDNTTQLALSLTSLDPSRYRLAWTGVGTAPAFRTARSLSTSGGTLTLTLNANQTVTATHSAGAVFGAVQVGDTFLLPGVATGDTGPFDPLNQGEWAVLAASSTSLTLARPTGSVFSGKSEAVAVTSNAQVQAYSPAGVQVGDVVDVVAGFSAAARHAYTVVAVTASRVEFVSTSPLADEVALPGTGGVNIYSAAKRFVRVEVDQEAAVTVNGADVRVEPVAPGDSDRPGWYETTGTCYTLSVRNRAAVPLNATLISAE